MFVCLVSLTQVIYDESWLEVNDPSLDNDLRNGYWRVVLG